jgi:hypothetical protein
MDALQFFLDQHTVIRSIVDDMVFKGLSDDQLRRSPAPGQNSLAWLLWHASRWEDFAATVVDTDRPQVLDQNDWLIRLNLSRRDLGTGMTEEECVDFNAKVNMEGLWAYWSEVGQQTRKTAESLMPEEWSKPVDEMRLYDTFANGAIGNERARWVEQFYSGRTKAWFLSFINWHHAEHLFGEALSVRSQAGIALGL